MKSQSLLWMVFLAVVVGCGSDDDESSGQGGAAGVGASGGVASGGAAGSGASGGTGGGGTAGTASGGTSGSGAGGGAGSAVGGAGGSAGAGTCSTAELKQPVPETAGQGSYPAPKGGTIADGTYVLSKWDIYPPGSIDPFMRSFTVVISGNNFQLASKKDAEPTQLAGGTLTSAGTELTLNVTCPQTTTIKQMYTATATELWLHESDGAGTNEVHIFTKQ